MSTIRYKKGDLLWGIVQGNTDIVLIVQNCRNCCQYKQITNTITWECGKIYGTNNSAENYFIGYKILTEEEKAGLL